jgi:hypothetical protein
MDGKEVVDVVSAEEYYRLRWNGPGPVGFRRSAPEFDLSISGEPPDRGPMRSAMSNLV